MDQLIDSATKERKQDIINYLYNQGITCDYEENTFDSTSLRG